jgi:Phage QLRG family, putative DNA packaging.
MLEKTKKRLQLTNDNSNELLEDIIEEIGYRILHFCNRDDIPVALEFTWLRMVVEAFKKNDASATSDLVVSSVSEGDTSVSYAQPTANISNLVNDIVMNYKTDLLHYKKIRTVSGNGKRFVKSQ